MQIQKFELFNKLNETGEWDRYITWNYVKDNPDCDNDECQIIKDMENDIEEIRELLTDDSIFILKDIRGFDIYQGAYACVKIYGKIYKIWKINYNFYIENFPISNSLDNGFSGDIHDIAEVINNFEIYQKVKKYNL